MEVKKDEDWMQKKWRPAMGWMYMLICLLDMAIFPVLWSLLQVFTKQPITQWSPLTLQGAGLFHLAMGAVLGIAAWGRTQEKVAGTASNFTPVSQPTLPAPAFQSQSFEMQAPPAAGPTWTSPVVASEPAPSFNPAPIAPGGRRPVTPGFNV